MQLDEREQFLYNEYMLTFMEQIAANTAKLADNGNSTGKQPEIKVEAKVEINSLDSLAKIAADKKAQPVMDKSFKIIASGIELIMTAVNKGKDADTVLNSLTELASKASEFAKDIVKPVATIALSLVAIGASIVLMGAAPIAKGLLMLTATALVLAGISKLADDGASQNIVHLAVGATILSLAIMTLSLAIDYIEPEAYVKAGVVLIGMMAATAAASKLLSGEDASKFGMSMMSIAGAVLLMTVALYAFDQMNVSVKSVALASVTMLALAAAVAIIGQGDKDILKGAITMVVIVATMAIVPMVLELYKSVSGDDLLMPGLVLGALTGAVYAVGKSGPTVLSGAAALVIMAGVVGLFPRIVQEYAGIDWADLGKPAAVLTGLTVAVAALGTSSVMVLAGAGAMAIVAASLWGISKALLDYQNISWEDLGKAAAVLTTLTVTVAAIGTASPVMLLGGAAMVVMAGGIWAIGKSVISLTEGMKASEGLDMGRASQAAGQVIDWAISTVTKFGEMSLGDMIKAKAGLWSIGQLGTTLASLAVGVAAISGGTYNEYAVDKQGNVKVVAVHKLTPSDFKNVGLAIDGIVSAITEPLAKFGEGGGLFTDSDTELGIESLSKIGSITQPIIDVAKNVKLLEKTDFSPFSRAVDSLVTNLQKPLSKVSETGSWFSSNDYAKGFKALSGIKQLVDPLVTLASKQDEIKALNPLYFTRALDTLIFGSEKHAIKGLGEIMAAVSETGTWVSRNDYKKGFKMLEGLPKVIDPMIRLGQLKPSDINPNAFLQSFAKLAYGLKKPLHEMTNFDSKAISNMKIVSETAKALQYIADADLTELAKYNNERQKSLFDKLDEMIAVIKGVSVNTGTGQPVAQTQTVNPFMQQMNLDIDKPEPATLDSISLQIDDLINTIRMQRA
jgi:hypothetical protein